MMPRGAAATIPFGLALVAAACLPSYEFTDAGAIEEAAVQTGDVGGGGAATDARLEARTGADAADSTAAADATPAADAADATAAADAPDSADAAPDAPSQPPLFVNQATIGLWDAASAAAAIGPQVAGDLNVVFIAWFRDPTPIVTSVTDTAGNAYALLSTASNTMNLQDDATTQSVFYADGIRVPDDGGVNMVTATTDKTAVFLDVRVAEYSGIHRPLATAPLVSPATSLNAVASITPASGARFVVVGAGNSSAFVGTNGCDIRVLNNAGDLICDLPAVGVPPLQVTLVNEGNGGWVVQWVTFR
jgi:hypothetical protein